VLPDQVLYRAEPDTDYGALNPVLRQSIRDRLIARHWEEMNRLAASFKDGLVLPSLVVAKLQALRRQNPVQQAIQELGRIPKTEHILTYADDPDFRRQVLVALNKHENVHALARVLCYGR
jgi:TnpA family transposase